MISYLKGVVILAEQNQITLSVGGVGYEVLCTQKTADTCELHAETELFIKTVVKEDDISLYGFKALEDKHWFEVVTNVQGVGPRMGLAILNNYDGNQLLEIVMSEDQKALKAVSGIGPKVASRIINELKSRKDLSLTPQPQTKPSNSAPASDDAISALVNLGFDRRQVFFAVKKVTADNDNPELEEVIKLALVELNKV